MKICQIKGTNGSGKTTIVKQLLSVSQDVEELRRGKIVYATTMNDIGWTAIGRYPDNSKMGGCDTIKTIQEMKDYIFWAMDDRPNNWIVFEGMMISTIKSTFYDYLLAIYRQRRNMYPLFVILKTTLDGCINRIAGRGTMKPNLNYENIYNKAQLVMNHAKTYDPCFVRFLDVENLELEEMLPAFLKAVNDKELLKVL